MIQLNLLIFSREKFFYQSDVSFKLMSDSARSDDNFKEVKLESPPEEFEDIMVALKWMEFLIGKVGHSGLEEVLEFYREISWINDDVLIFLEKLAMGFRSFRNEEDKKYITEEEADHKPQNYLSSEDHIRSLLFIEVLRDEEVDKDVVAKIEKKIERIKSKADDLSNL